MVLKFKVYEQTISLQSTKSEPRQGSKDYLELQFSFSSDWNDLLKYVYLQHGEVSVPHDLVEESIIVDEYFTEQTEFNVTLLGKSADGSVEVPTNVVTILLKESNNLWEKDAPEPQNSWIVQVVDARDAALAAAIRAENAAIHQPYPNSETGTWWVWNAETGAYTDTGVSAGGSVTVDSELSDTSTNPVQNKVIKSALDAICYENRFIVTFTMDDSENIASDKTFFEIFDAYKAGKRVSGVALFAPNDWYELYVSTVNSDGIDFFAISRDLSDCMYVDIHVSRTGGISLYTGFLTQPK